MQKDSGDRVFQETTSEEDRISNDCSCQSSSRVSTIADEYQGLDAIQNHGDGLVSKLLGNSNYPNSLPFQLEFQSNPSSNTEISIISKRDCSHVDELVRGDVLKEIVNIIDDVLTSNSEHKFFVTLEVDRRIKHNCKDAQNLASTSQSDVVGTDQLVYFNTGLAEMKKKKSKLQNSHKINNAVHNREEIDVFDLTGFVKHPVPVKEIHLFPFCYIDRFLVKEQEMRSKKKPIDLDCSQEIKSLAISNLEHLVEYILQVVGTEQNHELLNEKLTIENKSEAGKSYVDRGSQSKPSTAELVVKTQEPPKMKGNCTTGKDSLDLFNTVNENSSEEHLENYYYMTKCTNRAQIVQHTKSIEPNDFDNLKSLYSDLMTTRDPKNNAEATKGLSPAVVKHLERIEKHFVKVKQLISGAMNKGLVDSLKSLQLTEPQFENLFDKAAKINSKNNKKKSSLENSTKGPGQPPTFKVFQDGSFKRKTTDSKTALLRRSGKSRRHPENKRKREDKAKTVLESFSTKCVQTSVFNVIGTPEPSLMGKEKKKSIKKIDMKQKVRTKSFVRPSSPVRKTRNNWPEVTKSKERTPLVSFKEGDQEYETVKICKRCMKKKKNNLTKNEKVTSGPRLSNIKMKKSVSTQNVFGEIDNKKTYSPTTVSTSDQSNTPSVASKSIQCDPSNPDCPRGEFNQQSRSTASKVEPIQMKTQHAQTASSLGGISDEEKSLESQGTSTKSTEDKKSNSTEEQTAPNISISTPSNTVNYATSFCYKPEPNFSHCHLQNNKKLMNYLFGINNWDFLTEQENAILDRLQKAAKKLEDLQLILITKFAMKSESQSNFLGQKGKIFKKPKLVFHLIAKKGQGTKRNRKVCNMRKTKLANQNQKAYHLNVDNFREGSCSSTARFNENLRCLNSQNMLLFQQKLCDAQNEIVSRSFSNSSQFTSDESKPELNSKQESKIQISSPQKSLLADAVQEKSDFVEPPAIEHKDGIENLCTCSVEKNLAVIDPHQSEPPSPEPKVNETLESSNDKSSKLSLVMMKTETQEKLRIINEKYSCLSSADQIFLKRINHREKAKSENSYDSSDTSRGWELEHRKATNKKKKIKSMCSMM